ncbi:MAG: GGDEF domain-containing protein [Magnetococcales bacterium]|nr:GGDEF domain-containing protein [Magnetococcales bacterium]
MIQFLSELSRSKLFRDLPAEIYLEELTGCPVISLAPEEILIEPGQTRRHVHLILTGTLSIHLDSRHSAPVRMVGAGEIVGELSIIANSVSSAWVVGHTSSQLLVIDETRLWRMIDRNPLIARNLLSILTGWITSVDAHVIDQRKEIDALRDSARIDGLTGLFNRRWFDDSLKQLLGRGHHPLVLILMDIDHFKQYNDLHGHPGGDHALRSLAELLKSMVRLHDVAARYGGEEFALILPDTAMEAACAVAERIRVAVMNLVIRGADGQLLPSITLSLGVAASEPDTNPESLIAQADARLYLAKRTGRNRWCA